MPIKILMPALSPTMTEGNLARWLKKEGDEVRSGDIIAEIETDKATMEVEAVDEGRLGKILVGDGTEGVKVNETIALLLEEGEDASSIEVPQGGGDGGTAPEPTVKEEPAAKEERPQPKAEMAAEAATPSAGMASAGTMRGNGAGGEGAGEKSAGERGERLMASPLAKRMAAQAGLDLGRLQGSGPHGRIVKLDIEEAIAKGMAKAAPAAEARAGEARPAEAPAAPAPTAAPAQAGVMQAGAIAPPAAPHEEIALSNMRKIIARRLAESKATIPHFYLTIDCRLDALLDMRSKLNAREGATYKLSVNDFVIKAVALALHAVPGCNASWGGDKLYQYKDVDISVAVAIEGGLITPIIRKADQKGLSTISNEMKDLAKRAKEGKLKPEEFQGGGFSISNLGMYGIREFSAVINPPQACILAVGAGEKRPVVEGDELKIATMMSSTLSVDHRVVDGALGAQFLAEFRKLVEDPMALLL